MPSCFDGALCGVELAQLELCEGYGRPGAMRLLVGCTFGYMRPGFHPWQHDNRALVVRTLATLTPPAGSGVAA